MLNSANSLPLALQATSSNPVRESITLILKYRIFSRVNALRVAFSLDGDHLT